MNIKIGKHLFWIMKTAHFDTGEKMYTNIIGGGNVWNFSYIHRSDHKHSLFPTIQWHSDVWHYNLKWWRFLFSYINHTAIRKSYQESNYPTTQR